MALDKQFEVLKWAFSFLKKHNREEKVAEILLQHHLNVSKSIFYTMMQEKVPAHVREKFISHVKEHAFTGIPVQHLIGYEHFYGRKFKVNKHVLIPRFETEELVQHVIHIVQTEFADQSVVIVDVGTGSGVIAISLALELPNTTVYATDISEQALKVANMNAEYHQASVHFLQGNFIQPIIENNINPQIIVSNPPYIKEADRELLSDTVKQFDPEIALFADHNGLAAYEKIMTQIKDLQEVSERRVCFEIGFDQALDVTALIKAQYPSCHVKTIRDINGKDRIISVHL